MKLLDAVVQAETTAERWRLLRVWEQQYGSISELAVGDRWSEVLSQSLTPNRHADLLRVYARSRKEYLDAVKPGGSPDEGGFLCHLTLLLLAEHLQDDLTPARNMIEELLLSGDPEMMHVASMLFERMGTDAWPSFPVICQALARCGVFENPFHIGIAVAACIRSDVSRITDLRTAISEGGDRQRQALLYSIEELGEMAAPLVDLILGLIKSEAADPETVSCAFIALRSLGVINPEVANAVKNAVNHSQWFIRGNAITAAGCLHLDPDEFVPLIVAHLDDGEGHDWTPAEKAIEALTRYGSQACPVLNKLLKEEGRPSKWRKLVRETITHIRKQPSIDPDGD